MLAGRGVGLNPVSGEVFVAQSRAVLPKPSRHDGNQAKQMQDLFAGLGAVSADLKELSSQSSALGSDIFEALQLILEDEELRDAAVSEIQSGWDAPTSIQRAVETFASTFVETEILRERLADIRQLARQVAAKIQGVELGLRLPRAGKFVLVVRDLTPSDTAEFTDAVIGVIASEGGPTSHTAIICRARGIPLVVQCPGALTLKNGDQVLVDPVGDRVVLAGSLSLATRAVSFAPTSAKPVISVFANIGSVADAAAASASAATGVGLFRTEMLYLASTKSPSSIEQAADYSEIFKQAPGAPIIARTMDPASDKELKFLGLSAGELALPREFLVQQLEAIEAARQTSGREVWVMAPMIAGELEALNFVALAQSVGSFKIGIMVEMPSMIADIPKLQGIVDFVSVGTNDLSRFLFGVERDRGANSELLNHWQPGLIAALAEIAGLSAAAGLPAGVCGESAADPIFSIVLAGLGFSSVSVSPSEVGQVRNALSSLSIETARRVAQAAIAGKTPAEAKRLALKVADELEG